MVKAVFCLCTTTFVAVQGCSVRLQRWSSRAELAGKPPQQRAESWTPREPAGYWITKKPSLSTCERQRPTPRVTSPQQPTFSLSLSIYLATSDASGVRDPYTEELRRGGVNGDEHVVTYENSLNTLYGASCRALYIMKLLGHPRVSVLGGGYEGWVQDGHPTTTEVQQTAEGSFQPKWNPSMWKGTNTVLLDV